MGLGIGLGIKLGGRVGAPYPTENLDTIIYNETYEDGGTTYYKTSIGVGLDVIGQDTDGEDIINFAPLNDARFDKGSYVGNAYGLPEYYDYPYVNIYFDETSEATRYHWKRSDFHYANILAQSLLLDNQFFLRAIATSETSNEIETAYQVNIYSTSQTGTALTKLKTWMRIAPAFEGDELLVNCDFSTGNLTGWSNPEGNVVVVDFKAIFDGTSATERLAQNVLEYGKYYRVQFKIEDYLQGSVKAIVGGNGESSTIVLSNAIINEILYNDATTGIGTFYIIGSSSLKATLPYVSVKEYYENYYKP